MIHEIQRLNKWKNIESKMVKFSVFWAGKALHSNIFPCSGGCCKRTFQHRGLVSFRGMLSLCWRPLWRRGGEGWWRAVGKKASGFGMFTHWLNVWAWCECVVFLVICWPHRHRHRHLWVEAQASHPPGSIVVVSGTHQALEMGWKFRGTRVR